LEERANAAVHEKAGRRGRSWPLKRIAVAMAVAALFFGAGVVVGRDNPKNSASDGSALNYSSVNQVYNLLKKDFDGNLNQTDLINGAKTGLVNAAGDPYTEFFNPAQAKTFNDELSGSITGIGAELGTDDSGNIVIVSPLAGYPADKAGLKPKDIISAVNGTATSGMSVDEVVSKIRGNPGTKVTLTITRGSAPAFNVAITRQKITLPSVTWHEDGSIGYLSISQFTSDTSGLAQKAAQEFKSKGVKGVVLDLRNDPGGYLSAAVDVSSFWLKQGSTVVSERRGATIVDTEYASGNNLLAGLPTVVLINEGSASASEITAGALRDNGIATLVGTKSFGKGSVQEVKNLPDGSELKITIARWYTPAGKNIDKQGLTPDVSVADPTSDQAKAAQDPQKDKAYQVLQSKL